MPPYANNSLCRPGIVSRMMEVIQQCPECIQKVRQPKEPLLTMGCQMQKMPVTHVAFSVLYLTSNISDMSDISDTSDIILDV